MTLRGTVVVPQGNMNNPLSLLWKKAALSLRQSDVVLIREHYEMQIEKAPGLPSDLYCKSGLGPKSFMNGEVLKLSQQSE